MAEFPSISILIPSLKRGDSESWSNLARLFEPGLLGKARLLLRNSAIERRVSPEDLVNTSLAKAWTNCQNRGDLRAESTREFAAFLLTILRHEFIDQCRPRNLEESSPSWFAPCAEGKSPSEMLMSDEDEIRLHATLAELSARHREVLVMRHFDGLKYREIAERLGATPGTIAGLARDGLRELTSRFKANTDR